MLGAVLVLVVAGASLPDRQDLPAWVQAIGSVLAIFVAVWVAHHQSAASDLTARRAQAEKVTAAYVVARDAANEVITYYRLEYAGALDAETLRADGRRLRRFRASWEAWVPTRHASLDDLLSRVEPTQVADGDFLVHLLTIRARLKWASEHYVPAKANGFVPLSVRDRLETAAHDTAMSLAKMRPVIDRQRDQAKLPFLAGSVLPACKPPEGTKGERLEMWASLPRL